MPDCLLGGYDCTDDLAMSCGRDTVEPPNKGHFGTSQFVLC